MIKWFIGDQGSARLRDLVVRDGERVGATAISAVGVSLAGESAIWVDRLEGFLVPPRGNLGGWTPIFEVAGSGLTLGEMSLDLRLQHTMRRRPLVQAREWLASRTPSDPARVP